MMDELIDGLQFQKAERPEKVCAQCLATVSEQYYQLAGADVCSACAAKAVADQERPRSGLVLRGFVYGLGAALVCSAGYALISWVTSMEIALIAILVGYLIGQAVRRGSNGLGGRRCQVIAVVLTYLSITASYVPSVVKGMNEARASAAEKSGGQPEPASVLILALEVIVAFGIALAVPFLGLAEGFSGLIGVAILFFGLQRAWQQTARDERLLMGPYSVTGEAATA